MDSSKVNKKRSEEINDIIDRMPMSFGRWVAIAILVFTSLFFTFGWIIKYPATVVGQIKINAQNATVRLVANASGNLHLLSYKAQTIVKKGDYIAVIQNSAFVGDIQKIAKLLENFDLNNTYLSTVSTLFPEKVSLGELDIKYYTFLSSLKAQCSYETDNIYEKQKKTILNDIKWKEQLIEESKIMLKTAKERCDMSQKWFDRYASLNEENIATYEYEVDQAKNNFLTMEQEVQHIIKEITSIQMQLAGGLNQLRQIEIEQKEKERILKLDVLSSFHDLNDNMKAWEQKYAFKAPFDGQLEFLQFLTEGQAIQAGEEVFGVVPPESKIYGQVLLPTLGAGKVKIGSRVTIKLDNYPYMEYGSIEGRVSSISLISQPQKIAENMIESYLINVDLPNGLRTNYGESLDFKYEIGGTADIVVKERRLIERLFDNLKYGVQ